MLYEAVEVGDATPVQYAGVYVLRWRAEWGAPQVLFKPAEDPLIEAAPKLLAACKLMIRVLESGNCAGLQMPGEFWAAYDNMKVRISEAESNE